MGSHERGPEARRIRDQRHLRSEALRDSQMMTPAVAECGPEPFCVLPGTEQDESSFSRRAAVSSGGGWLRHCAESQGEGSRAGCHELAVRS